MEDSSAYKSYPYSHYSLASQPKITSDIIDEQIAKLMDLLNQYPTGDIKQLKVIEQKIKDKIKEKEDKYLIQTSEPINRNTTKRVGFTEGTKLGGRKRKNKKTRKNRRHRKH
jgi:hypothetical protein